MAGGSIWDSPASTSGGGSIWDTPGASTQPVKPASHGRGGVFGALSGAAHFVGHEVVQTGKNLESAAVGLGPGLYQIGKVGGNDALAIAEGAPSTDPRRVAANKFGNQILHGITTDLRHPLRNPGNTLLDVLPVVNAVGKAGEAGAIASREGAVAAAKSLVTKRPPEPRFVKAPNGAKVEAGVYSRSATGRVVQKALDSLREKHPDSTIVARRIGKQRFQNERVNANIANFDNHALLAKAKGLNKAQQLSVRVVAERVPLQTRIADARRLAGETDNATVRKMLNNHATLLERVGHYVEDTTEGPRYKANQARLMDVYDHAKRVADQRTHDLVKAGMLTAEGAAQRESSVAQHFNPDLAHEVPGSDFFISYRNAKAAKMLGGIPATGVSSSIGVPRKLEELGHQFTGESIKTGNVNPKTVEQVAKDSQRANKVVSVWRQRDELGRLAVDFKASDNHIPIRPIWLKSKKWPEEIRQAIQGLDQTMTPEEEASRLEKIREFMFPKVSASVGTRVKGVKWIDARHVGDLNTPATLGAGERIARIGDRVNGPFRGLTLFRPGYVPPNLANNLFINAIHGSLHHIGQASRVAKTLGPAETAKIDALMGEGKVVGAGRPVHEFGQKVQQGLSKAVDVVPRRAAWLHEAGRFGYKTSADVRRLLNDEAVQADLRRVTREANGEMIDYGNLNAQEQSLVRRLLFLYPWVKGATVYGGRFLREHPVKAGAAGILGQQGERFDQQTFGDLPSYARGIIPGPGGSVINTEPLNNLPQPVQSLQTLIGLGVKNPEQRNQLLGQTSPIIQALLDRSAGATLESSLSGASVIRLLQEALQPNASPKKVYPQSRNDALIRFLLGSAAPRQINLPNARQSAARERTGR